MTKRYKTAKPCPTDLTWEERNSSSYLFNVEVLTKLQQTIKKSRGEEMKVEGKKGMAVCKMSRKK
jgi:hypothetical protein